MDTTELDGQTREAEIEAIKQVVATLEHATKHELPDEFVGLFRADAIWTTGGGKRLRRSLRDLGVHAPGAPRWDEGLVDHVRG